MTSRVYPLAKMSGLFLGLSALVLGAAAFLAVSGLLEGRTDRLAGALVLFTVAALVWVLARPSRFEISGGVLSIVFPLYRRAISRSDITSARVLRAPEYRAEIGRAVRVGVGGLFGTLGLLWTSKRGWVEIYVSTTDYAVLIERRTSRPLLISPRDPEAFVEALVSPG